jgi:hypothetical protein
LLNRDHDGESWARHERFRDPKVSRAHMKNKNFASPAARSSDVQPNGRVASILYNCRASVRSAHASRNVSRNRPRLQPTGEKSSSLSSPLAGAEPRTKQGQSKPSQEHARCCDATLRRARSLSPPPFPPRLRVPRDRSSRHGRPRSRQRQGEPRRRQQP